MLDYEPKEIGYFGHLVSIDYENATLDVVPITSYCALSGVFHNVNIITIRPNNILCRVLSDLITVVTVGVKTER